MCVREGERERARERECVRACVHACACVCVRVCVPVSSPCICWHCLTGRPCLPQRIKPSGTPPGCSDADVSPTRPRLPLSPSPPWSGPPSHTSSPPSNTSPYFTLWLVSASVAEFTEGQGQKIKEMEGLSWFCCEHFDHFMGNVSVVFYSGFVVLGNCAQRMWCVCVWVCSPGATTHVTQLTSKTWCHPMENVSFIQSRSCAKKHCY